MNKYWFRPKRIGRWVALYYPTSIQGWIITMVLIAAAIRVFILIDATSHSGSDTLFRFAPWAISIMLLFDLACFRRGEYPWWWRPNAERGSTEVSRSNVKNNGK